MKHKILAIILSALLAVSGAALCGCDEKETATAATEAVSVETVATAATEQATTEDGTQSGILRSIDVDNMQVTVDVMEGNFGGFEPQQGGSGDGQQPPEMPGSSGNGDSQQPPEKPDGSDSGDGQQPPEMSGAGGNGDSQQPPEKPDGSDSGDGQQPSEIPGSSGNGDGQQPSGKPDGDGTQGAGNTQTFTVTDQTVITGEDGSTVTLADLSENTMVSFTADGENLLTLTVNGAFSPSDSPMGGSMSGSMGGPGGGSSAPSEYSAQNHYTDDATVSSETQSSTGTDESIVWVSDGATVTLSGITADRTSSDSTGGDNSSFYGVGAAYLVTDGTLNISGSTITTDAAGGAGVFAYGTGVANVSDTVITTAQGTSGGIHVAGGGTLNASNLTVETSGASSAAIRSDRGSGTMVVNGGSYTSNGSGSPAVYSTADITVSDATLTANDSEAVCIEGKNSLNLTNCDVTSNMPDDEQNDCRWSVILYQSMSGDSEVGNSNFIMTGGSFISKAGGLFYTTNTASSFTLQAVDIKTATTPDFFLKCTGNSNKRGWGSSGSNGAQCTFTAINQQMDGDVIWDSISTLDLFITENSTLQGAIIDDESCAGNGGTGYANVTVDKTSVWIVTGNSTVTVLTNYGMITDAQGKTVTVVGTDGTVYVQGDSAYTVTVQSYVQ